MKYIKQGCNWIAGYFFSLKTMLHRRSGEILDFLWFFFIAIILGQLGALLAIADSWWKTGEIVSAIQQQAESATLITFSTALLASSAYFIVREYNRNKIILRRTAKSILVLLAALVGMIGTVIAFQLTVFKEFSRDEQVTLHWIIYLASISLSFLFWLMDEFEQPATVFTDELKENAVALQSSSKAISTTSDGTKL